MTGKARVYLETTFVYSLTDGRGQESVVDAARRAASRDWWEKRRAAFMLFASQLVVDEVSRGEPASLQARIEYLRGMPLLSLTDSVETLAGELLARGIYPQSAVEDVMHFALATVHGMDYFLTWDCRQFANAEIAPALQQATVGLGYTSPVICTPEQLMGADS